MNKLKNFLNKLITRYSFNLLSVIGLYTFLMVIFMHFFQDITNVLTSFCAHFLIFYNFSIALIIFSIITILFINFLNIPSIKNKSNIDKLLAINFFLFLMVAFIWKQLVVYTVISPSSSDYIALILLFFTVIGNLIFYPLTIIT
ncbi:MAG: hypothetical protein IJH34_10120, partial [Romboutsia sp.]|nr:hypothetical protein [Romboutsia sp.]